MGLTRTDWRTLKIAAIVLVPVEIAALRVLDTITLDVEPVTKPTTFEVWRGLAVVVLHYPAILFGAAPWGPLPSTLWWAALFLNGYALMFGVLFTVLYLNRAIRKLISTL